jgi:hypothetical protein
VTGREGPAPPPLDAVLAVDPSTLSGKLLAIPDEENALLRLADGRRTVKELLDGSGLDERLALASLGRLLDGGVLRVLSRGPDGADWFADPGAAAADEPGAGGAIPEVPAPAAEPPPETPPEPPPEPPPEEARAPGAARPGRARAWVVVAAVVLGALLLAGTVWARRQMELSPLPQASPSGAERRGAETPPPALLVTEPAPSAAYREAMAEAGARYQAGDLAGAAAACRRATDVDPAIGAGWMALGEVQLAAGDRAGARAAFERYLAVEPEGRHASRVRELLQRLRP